MRVNTNPTEEFERQRTLKRLQAYRELDLLQISEVLQTMMTVSKQCSPAVTDGDSQSVVTDIVTDHDFREHMDTSQMAHDAFHSYVR